MRHAENGEAGRGAMWFRLFADMAEGDSDWLAQKKSTLRLVSCIERKDGDLYDYERLGIPLYGTWALKISHHRFRAWP